MRAFVLVLVLTLAGCGLTGGALVTGRVPTGTILIENQSSLPIDVVLLSRCRSSTYGLNRIDRSEPIPSGYYRPFTVDAGCWSIAVGRVGYGDTRRSEEIRPGGTFRFTITDG